MGSKGGGVLGWWCSGGGGGQLCGGKGVVGSGDGRV